MSVIESALDPNSEEYRQNRDALLAAVEEFRAIEQAVVDTAEGKRAKFEKRGQLLPHERISRLLDTGSPFLSLMNLAGYKMHDDKDGTEAGGSTIAGIGYVSGVRCLVTASNSAIKGGTISPSGLHKTLRLQRIAMENKLPVVSLVESGGANLNYAAEVFVDGARTFANQARLSAAGIPQITVVHGNATAGGAYQPGLSDYVVVVRERAKMFLAGPPLLKAATGEIATDEELGGAEMHSGTAGTAEYLAENDADGIRQARDLVKLLGWRRAAPASDDFEPPRYDAEELLSVVPADAKKPYDVREVIGRIVDGSDFDEFKRYYGDTLVTGFAEVNGCPVGIVANNGVLFSEAAQKGAHFVELCSQRKTPLVFLQNITGFMVGRKYENEGIARHGAKMVTAVATTSVPKITMLVGGSFGAGNYGMSGRAYQPRFLWTWPNSRISVMGGAQAAGVLATVKRDAIERGGGNWSEAEETEFKRPTIKMFEEQSHPLYASARLWDDGIIDPRKSREVLALSLSAALNAPIEDTRFGVFRM